MRDISTSAYDVDVPDDAVSIGTRCCGATSVHFVDCRERLNVDDPASYRKAPPECDQCGLPMPTESYEFPDGEGGTLVLCGQCWAGVK